MLARKILLACTISLISIPVISLRAYAEARPDSLYQSAINSNQNQRQVEDSYTARQKLLANGVRKIANFYYQNTGKTIPINSQSMQMMMKLLGALPEEENFIKQQIIANSDAQAAIPRVDALINRTQNFLNCLNNGGNGCIP